MKKVILISLLLISFGCSSVKEQLQKESLYVELSKGFSLEKVPNWTFHGYHKTFNYTPTPLMDIGNEYVYNNVSAYKFKAPLETDFKTYLLDFHEKRGYYISNVKMYPLKTDYEESYVFTYDSNYSTISSKVITQFYFHKKHVYYVSYKAKVDYFDTYYDEAITIMKTFKIKE